VYEVRGATDAEGGSVSGPFRELFVEVPLALLEAAVKQAETQKPIETVRPSAVASLIDVVNGTWLGEWLCERFDWDAVSMHRDACDRTCVIRARLWCGHTKAIRLSENLLESTPATNYADIIAEHDERKQHVCYHVRRERS
jgi:hypothetical protein